MIPVGELMEWMRLEGQEDYQLVKDLEASVVDNIERWTGRSFGPVAQVVEIIDGTGCEFLHLTETPEPSPAVVVEERNSDNTWTALDAADFEVDGRAVYRVDGGLFWFGSRRWRVTYDAGYAAGSEPPAVRQAVKHAVAHFYENREKVVMEEDVSEIPGVKELLIPFRDRKI